MRRIFARVLDLRAASAARFELGGVPEFLIERLPKTLTGGRCGQADKRGQFRRRRLRCPNAQGRVPASGLDLRALRRAQAIVEKSVDGPGESGMPGLIGGDFFHATAQLGILCSRGLVGRQQGPPGLAYTALGCILDRDLES